MDPASALADREANMKAMTPEQREQQLKQEQLMRDAQQQGNQGNLVMENGEMKLLSEDDMGASECMPSLSR